MKKVLSIIMVLAMLAMSVSISVFAEDAELGTYDNPYQVQAGAMTPTGVNVPAGGEAYVFVDDANNSTLTIGYATSAEYQVYYCRQPLTPETDGTLVFPMVNGADYFCIINPSESDITVRIMLEAGSGEANYGTMDNPEPLTLASNMFGGIGADAERALEAGNQGYHFTVTAPADGLISVSAGAMDADYNFIDWMYCVNNITAGIYGDNNYSDVDEPVYYEELEVSEGDELQIFVTTYNPQNPWSNPEGNINVSISFSPVGSYMYPEKITAGSHSATLEAGNFNGYCYVWTATESGTATITMDSASNWSYNVSGITADDEYFYFGDYHWFDDDPAVPSESVTVNAGDVLTITVNTYDSNSGMAIDGTVEWTLSFVPGEGNTDDGKDDGDEGDEDIGGGDIVPDCNYIHNGDALQLGTHTYNASNMYAYTLFDFVPENTGKYTFSSTNAFVGLASSNGMWITVGESTDYISEGVVSSNTFEWTCTGIGQSIWVAVSPDEVTADITVEYEDVEIKEIPKEDYENTTAPEAFDFGGDADALNYVDTFDGVEDTAVLGTDGYYHLNTADGPILFADLNDTLMSLETANSYGQLKQLIYEDGEVVMIIDYTLAMIDYLACMDVDTGLYPLTADLIEVFDKAGTSLGWYGAEGWIGGDEADAWMFACYYDEAIRGEADIPTGDNGGNAGNGTTNGDAQNGNDGAQGNTTAPSTGDNILVIVTVALVALVATASILVIRRRRTNN